MDPNSVIDKLEINQGLFASYLSSLSKAETLFRPNADHWCLLEIICHLVDEAKFDFRTRVLLCLQKPELNPPPYDPVDLVTSEKYIDQDFETKVHDFVTERKESILQLRKLIEPEWQNGYIHKYHRRKHPHARLVESWKSAVIRKSVLLSCRILRISW